MPRLGDLLVREGNVFHVAHLAILWLQTVWNPGTDTHDNGVFQLDGLVLLFLALRADTKILKQNLGHLLTAGERLKQLGRGLVDFLGDP